MDTQRRPDEAKREAPDCRASWCPICRPNFRRRLLDALPNNLPQTLSTFIDREREIAQITALVDQYRLVTLVGSGGLGKTRAALQVAANLLEGSGEGV